MDQEDKKEEKIDIDLDVIEDFEELSPNGSIIKNKINEDEYTQADLNPYAESDVEGEIVTKPKLIKCKGCGKLFTNFLRHVNSKSFERCKKFYDKEELIKHFEEAKERRKKSIKKYRQSEGAKEKEKEHKKKYRQSEDAKIKGKEHKKKYRQTERSKEKERDYKQRYRQAEGVKEKEKEHKQKYRLKQILRKNKKGMIENIIKRLRKAINKNN